MHKRLLISAILALVLVPAFAQEVEEKPLGAHPWKSAEGGKVATEMSSWSLIFHGGANYFDGDYHSQAKAAIWYPAVGIDLEYSFMPILSLGMEYMYDMYRIKSVSQAMGTPQGDLLRGQMHKAGLYLSADLMNCWFMNSTKKIFSLQLIGGGGVGWYKNDVYFDDKSEVQGVPNAHLNFQHAPFLMGGANFEFNLNRSLALGIRAMYHYYTVDDIDGIGPTAVASKNNDGIVDLTLNLRYKIDAVHKTHMRNISSLKAFENASIDKKVANEVQKQLASAHDTVDRTSTYIPAGRDTIVIIHKDTIYQKTEQTVTPNADYYFVYFKTGKCTLDEEGLKAVQQYATRLERDPNLYAVVTGNCDNTGSAAVNNALGEARAQAVANELIEEHSVDPERVAVCGRGIIVGKRSKTAYAPNRRAEVQFVSKAEFEQFKNECAKPVTGNITSSDEESSVSTTGGQQKQVSASAYEGETIDKVTVTRHMTLSKLARRFYHNTNCWVFIYNANRDVMSNPNDIEPDTELVIPQLDDSQKAITKEECQKLYESIQ